MFSMIAPIDYEVARLKSHLAGLRCKRTAPLPTRRRAENYATQTAGKDRAEVLAAQAEGIVEFHPWAPRIQQFTPAQWRRLKKRHNRTRNRTQGATPVYTAIDESAGAPR